MPLYLRTLITVTQFYLVYLNMNLIVYRKFRRPAARVTFQIAKFDHITSALIDVHWLPVMFSLNCSFLFTSHYTTKVPPTLKIFYAWNQLLIMLFVRLHNLFCPFQKSTALYLGTGPLLMLHLFYGTRCH